MKIYFLVATQHDNLGDLLINKMLIDELSIYGDIYVDMAGLPQKFKDHLLEKENVNDFEVTYGGSLKRQSMFKMLTKIKLDFDYYFKSPGPSGGEDYKFSQIIKRLVITYQFRSLSKSGLKLNLIGNDITIKNKFNTWSERYSNGFFDNTLVRSRQNVKKLKEANVNNVDYIPDVAFLFNDYSNTVTKKKVLISLRNLNDLDYDKKIEEYLSQAIPFFISKGLEVCFFHQVESDKDYNEFLYNKFKKLNCNIISDCIWYNDIVDTYSESVYLITNRLHVMILGIVHHVIPFLILKDDAKTSKINRILSDNNIECLISDSIDNVREHYENQSKLKSQIIDIARDNKVLCKEKISIIFNR